MQVKYASWSQVHCNLRILRTLVYVLLSYQLSTYFYRTTEQPIDWVSRHFVLWSDFSESEHSTVLIHSCTKNLSSFWAPKLPVVPLINAQLQCELTLILFFFHESPLHCRFSYNCKVHFCLYVLELKLWQDILGVVKCTLAKSSSVSKEWINLCIEWIHRFLSCSVIWATLRSLPNIALRIPTAHNFTRD